MRFLLHEVADVSIYSVSRYELFNAYGGSCPSLPCLSHYVTFSFTPLSSSFELIFSSHVIAYIVSFDSRFETRKSDIIWPRYELSNACVGSCPSLPCLWHYVTFSFTPLSLRIVMLIFSSHVVTYLVSFDWRFETRKSDIIRPRYEVFIGCGSSCLSLCSLLHDITLPFHSLLSALVLEFRFFHPMW